MENQVYKNIISVKQVSAEDINKYGGDTIEIRLRNSQQAQAAIKAGIPVYEREIQNDRVHYSYLFIRIDFADLIKAAKPLSRCLTTNK